MDSRREFLTGLVVMGALAGVLQEVKMPLPKPPQSQENKGVQDAPPDNPNRPSPEKRVLEANEKDIKKKVEQLYQLAMELKAEVDKTDSSKVLSLTMVKKAEEIEKLARDIKNRSKG